MLRNVFCVVLVFFLSASKVSARKLNTLRFEAYVTAKQVERLFATEQDRVQALRMFDKIKISKVWLEFVRHGHSPDKKVLAEVRDFFVSNQINASGGITTTAGKDFGLCSTGTFLFLNYQSDKTQQDMFSRIKEFADVFDEIIVDDFFATEDTSDMSKKEKRDSSWSQYRMNLMCDFALRFMIEPARSVNSDVRLIIKYPQWYDRFHPYGYDVVRQPEIFDGVWVGTETRNPQTETFGYVMPTQGYINYCWLRSVAKEKTGGAWFDFHDCTPAMYLMQAYQSVLAGAEEIILFDIEKFINQSDSAKALVNRYDAVSALSGLLRNRKALGTACYKPPHSDGSDAAGGANLFIYDYIASSGLSPIMTSAPPLSVSSVFLSRHAAADKHIGKHIRKWIKDGVCLVMTPDFIAALNDAEITRLAGYNERINLTADEKQVAQFVVDGDKFKSSSIVSLRPIAVPQTAKILCAGLAGESVIPILTRRQTESGCDIFVLNMSTFTHKEIIEAPLMLLPTRPLDISQWPERVTNRIRSALPSPYPLNIKCPNNMGVYFYQGNILVLASFQDVPVEAVLTRKDGQPNTFFLDTNFPHITTTGTKKTEKQFIVTVGPWELAVIRW